ncbi:Sorting nexin-27 [Strongyloides ratti]|uniref:Sorting nexin-27 n=1 Tax=Strongyloides ratti TaxID=34506 RepID=A0A090LEI6_STRRB|nr:Sorting nexin-27 [Strongyloides ratti]CEF65935.1 Sorting nexin-27 [Strongyloides ratti]
MIEESITSSKVFDTNKSNGINDMIYEPHNITIVRCETGFGFNVKGQISEGGQLRSINGQLYAPLQHVSAILHGGAAERAGLKMGDNILEVNGNNVEGATHRQVVELIKNGGDKLKLLVISVPEYEYHEIDFDYDSSDYYSRYDYTEKRSLPITIPNYQVIKASCETFIAYNIYMAGRHLVSRRYNDFIRLNKYLKDEFNDYDFPKLPKRWPFKLSEQKLDARRRGLESYLEKLCAVKVIADSEIMQEFLMEETEEYSRFLDVTLKIQLPDTNVVSLMVKKNQPTWQVMKEILERMEVEGNIIDNVGIFELIDDNFYRLLGDEELPHYIFIHNYSSIAVSSISFRKFIFNIDEERKLCKENDLFKQLCYYQVINDIDKGILNAKDRTLQLRSIQSVERIDEYLDIARQLDDYNKISFPETESNFKSKVILTISYDRIKINFSEPEKVSQVIDWRRIQRYYISNQNSTFNIEYKNDKKIQILQLFTHYCSSMFLTFEKVTQERRKLEKKVNNKIEEC